MMRLTSLLDGLSYAHKLYEDHGDKERAYMWSHNIKWAILTGCTWILREMPDEPQTARLIEYITQLAKAGFFDDATGVKENEVKEYFAVINQTN
ncbi:MAG: hypothetical protein MSB00_07420 [Prevotella sp.]|nr:hypothetical protein [Prevotella sp.]MCI7426856.1 hypothetical protein [Prevotella sp.]MDY5471494.1 hypothetical protein [Prevotella sp.]MEE0488349.1 hypothetical protein [Prevotella sp.]